MTEVLSQQELGTLMASVDVFVSLHRSEGYGLLLLQPGLLIRAEATLNLQSTIWGPLIAVERVRRLGC